MTNNEITMYYDYLLKLAASKCTSQTDAEDIVGDTMLAAFAYIAGGGTIGHPKTWLANTLMHKLNDALRRKYRTPVTVCLDDGIDIPCDDCDAEYLASEEEAAVRAELNCLAYITREVLIRYYYGCQSIAEIADGLRIPEGTVKSRLSAGRSQLRKGLETMETRENHLPGQLWMSFGGSDGAKGEPTSLIENDLIAQNLLMLAYDKPLTVSELSRAIGIPAAYIEPIIKKLTDGELMAVTDGGRVYSDFIIMKPQHRLANFKPQLDFAHRHFDTVWSIMHSMSDEIAAMPCVREMGSEERTKLDRYAVLRALQEFQHCSIANIEMPKFPKRKDGGRWYAQATAVEAGYNMKEYNAAAEYSIRGGHRTTQANGIGRTKHILLCEFDTTLYDSPCRYGGAFEFYFKHIIPLLWHIHDGIPLEASDIPNEFIAYIPMLERFGLLGHADGKLCVKIPVLEKSAFKELCGIIAKTEEAVKAAIGDEYAAFVAGMKTPIPKHLTSVPELFRYSDSGAYIVMAIVREAYEKGLHLNGVDYCCPPVVMAYEI